MSKEHIQNAVHILQQGGLVAFPTETVYGLGADARNEHAVAKIFRAKNRPQNHPLIVHIGSASEIADWACAVSDKAWRLAEAFWPGPLTLILKKKSSVLDAVTGGQETVGLRVPSHPVALELLKSFGSGIAAPSANRFQRISPTTKHAVIEELGDAVDFVLEGGQCMVGLESTIVDMSGDNPVILRPGMITSAEISNVLEMPLGLKNNASPKVSGSHEIHYAPQTKAFVMARDAIVFEKSNVYLLLNPLSFSHPNVILMPDNAKDYAHTLYQTLRELDKQNFQKIIIEKVPEYAEWEAVRDRLQRAGSTR